jgi:hypothetical protein
MMKRSIVFALGLVAVLAASQVQAGTITTLHSTGEGLAVGALDTNYVMVAPGDLPGTTPFVTGPTNPGSPPWAGPVPTANGAQWISAAFPEPTNGAYNYQTTFSLTGFLASTAVITINKISADDELLGVLLNGNLVPITTPDQSYGTFFGPFTLSSGFVSGTNTLTFLTDNTHEGDQGLIVDMTGTATAVPEPASLALLGIGLSGLFTLRRFFKRTTVA